MRYIPDLDTRGLPSPDSWRGRYGEFLARDAFARGWSRDKAPTVTRLTSSAWGRASSPRVFPGISFLLGHEPDSGKAVLRAGMNELLLVRMPSAIGTRASLEAHAVSQWGLLRETTIRTRFATLSLTDSSIVFIEARCWEVSVLRA